MTETIAGLDPVEVASILASAMNIVATGSVPAGGDACEEAVRRAGMEPTFGHGHRLVFACVDAMRNGARTGSMWPRTIAEHVSRLARARDHVLAYGARAWMTTVGQERGRWVVLSSPDKLIDRDRGAPSRFDVTCTTMSPRFSSRSRARAFARRNRQDGWSTRVVRWRRDTWDRARKLLSAGGNRT